MIGPEKLTPYNIDPFTRAYVEATLWTALDWDDQDENGNPAQMDEKYSSDDFAHSTLSAMVAECFVFQEANDALLSQAYEIPGYTASQAGHDFSLTRNRHGAGFWDRGLGAIGKQLTELSHPWGEINLYVRDGKIYAE